jgi:hypothetical protein
MLRNPVKLVYNPPAALLAFHPFQPVLERLGHRLGFALACQGRENRCEFFSFSISNVQGHNSPCNENHLHCYSVTETTHSGKKKGMG